MISWICQGWQLEECRDITETYCPVLGVSDETRDRDRGRGDGRERDSGWCEEEESC